MISNFRTRKAIPSPLSGVAKYPTMRQESALAPLRSGFSRPTPFVKSTHGLLA